MPESRARLASFAGLLAAAALGGSAPGTAAAAPDAPVAKATAPVGSYTRYTRRLEDEAVHILTPEIGGPVKTTLAAHGLDLWGCLSISEWRQSVLRWAPATDRALTVLIRRTEVLFAEENVDEAYNSTILQLGSVHAMQRGLTRVLEALGVAAPAPVSAHGLGAGTPSPLPTAPSTVRPTAPQADLPAPDATYVRAGNSPPLYSMSPAPQPIAPVNPTVVRAAPLAPGTAAPMPTSPLRRRPTPSPTPAPARALPAAQSPFELAAYQGALARESYRVLYPEIENGAQVALAAKRSEMRNAATVAEWKQLLSTANPAFAKAAAVLERRAEVLRGESKVMDPFESPHTQKAAVFGLQAGLEKILSLYGK